MKKMAKYFKRDSSHAKAQKAAKERDGYMCMICGKYCDKAEGHHVIYVSEGGPPTTQNMITLCKACHTDYHAGRLKVDLGTL